MAPGRSSKGSGPRPATRDAAPQILFALPGRWAEVGLLGRGVKQRNIGWMSDEVLFRPEGYYDGDSSKCLAPIRSSSAQMAAGSCGSAGVPGPWVLSDSGDGRSAPGFPGPHPVIRAGPSSILAVARRNPQDFFSLCLWSWCSLNGEL